MGLRLATRNAFSLFLFFTLVAFAFPARAGFWIEPYTGYFASHHEVSFVRDGQLTYRADGWLLGVRSGWAYRVFYFGLDWSLFHGDSKLQNDSSATYNSQGSHIHGTTLGAIFGARKGDFRLYGGLNFQSDVEFQTSPIEQTFKSAGGYRIGLSWDAVEPVSINIEGVWTPYNKYTDIFGEQSINDGSGRSDAHASTLILSISVPWDFDPAGALPEPGQSFWKRRPRPPSDD
jgi:hypothetical protein